MICDCSFNGQKRRLKRYNRSGRACCDMRQVQSSRQRPDSHKTTPRQPSPARPQSAPTGADVLAMHDRADCGDDPPCRDQRLVIRTRAARWRSNLSASPSSSSPSRASTVTLSSRRSRGYRRAARSAALILFGEIRSARITGSTCSNRSLRSPKQNELSARRAVLVGLILAVELGIFVARRSRDLQRGDCGARRRGRDAAQADPGLHDTIGARC